MKRKWVGPLVGAIGLAGLAGGLSIALGSGGQQTEAAPGQQPEGITWQYTLTPKAGSLSDFDEVLANAKLAGKPVMVDFFADWCGACKELERLTYVEPRVWAELQRFIRVKVDSTEQTELIDQVQKRYGVQGLPTLIFFSSSGEWLPERLVMGFIPAEPFLGELKKVP